MKMEKHIQNALEALKEAADAVSEVSGHSDIEQVMDSIDNAIRYGIQDAIAELEKIQARQPADAPEEEAKPEIFRACKTCANNTSCRECLTDPSLLPHWKQDAPIADAPEVADKTKGRADTANKREIGLYEKYRVSRTDGSSAPGGKHEHCVYFVLDLDHDPFAIPAIRAYAEACNDKYPTLAADLRCIETANCPGAHAFDIISQNDAPEVADAPKESFRVTPVTPEAAEIIAVLPEESITYWCGDCEAKDTRIEELEAEVARLRAQNAELVNQWNDLNEKHSALEVEVERLQGERDFFAKVSSNSALCKAEVKLLQEKEKYREQDRRDHFFAAAMQALMIAYAVDKTADRVSFDGIIEYAEKYATAAMEAATLPREDKNDG